MTARTPLESMEAASDGSLESTASREEASSSDDRGHNGANGEPGEASLSRTLEAILSKTDDDEVPLGGEITGTPSGAGKAQGGQTLLGLGGYGSVKLPGVTPVDVEAAGPSISVDTMFDDPEDDFPGKAMAPPVGPAGRDLDEGEIDPRQIEREEEAGGKVGDLLDEVAQALNVQAAETRDRAIGRVPSPGANASGARGALKTPLVRTAEEFEFEDPDDGPTTLNAGDGKLEAAASRDDDEDDEESVVLGPGSRSEGKREPRITGSHPGANLAATGTRNTLPIPAVPMPGSGVSGSARTSRATPFAGLPAATLPTFPAPGSGRSRLPTPAPGTALGIPGTATATAGRSALPPGAPASGREESAGAIPLASLEGPGGSRSSGRMSASSGAEVSGRNGAVQEAHPSALSSARLVLEQALLKKDLKFRAISFGGIILVVFVGGLFIGHAVLKGSPETTASAPPAVPASAAVAPAVAGPGPAAPSVAAPAAAPAAPATTAAAPVISDVPKNAAVVAPPQNANVAPAGATAEATAAGTAQMQFDEQPLRKRRPRRVVAAPKDDVDLAPAPKRVAAVTPPPISKAPTAGKPGPKKKSTWHDPFAD